MVRAAALACILALTGCDSPLPRSQTAERAELAHVDSRNALAQIAVLSDRIEQLEAEAKTDRALLVETHNDLNSLRDTFNSNVRSSNALDEKVVGAINRIEDRLGYR